MLSNRERCCRGSVWASRIGLFQHLTSRLDAFVITCEAVIAESCYLLRNLRGACGAVIDNVAAGIFQIPFQLSRDTLRVKQVLRKYVDHQIDFADACLIGLAEEFGTPDIVPLGDFAIYRWGKNKPFRTWPAIR